MVSPSGGKGHIKRTLPHTYYTNICIIYIYTEVLVQRGVLGPSTCLSGAFAVAVRRCRQGAQNGCSALPWCCQCTQKGCSGCLSLIQCRQGDQNGSKRFKNVQKGAKRLKKALEKAVRACPVPPVRPKRLFEPASVPPVRSKRLFETAVRDHYSKVLGSATLCSEPLYSALLCSVHVYARVHTSIYIYLYKCSRSGSLLWSPCCGLFALVSLLCTLCASLLWSPCCVHVYARVHTSMYK